jgi:hypothetical protein
MRGIVKSQSSLLGQSVARSASVLFAGGAAFAPAARHRERSDVQCRAAARVANTFLSQSFDSAARDIIMMFVPTGS